MEKFLSGSFKLGKVFSVIAITISAIVLIIATLFMILSVKHYKINYYTPQELQAFEKSEYEVNKVSNIQLVEKQFGDEIKLILVNSKFDNNHYKNIITVVADLKPQYRKGYVEHLENFITEGKTFAEEEARKEAKGADKALVDRILKQYKNNIERASIISYNNMYVSQVNNIEADKTADVFYRLWLIGIILASILVFISFLVVPLLIKIEENTRK